MNYYNRSAGVFLVTFALCSVWSAGVLAQPSFELGFKFGLGLAKLAGNDTELRDCARDEYFEFEGGYGFIDGCLTDAVDALKVGFVAGAYATTRIIPELGVRLEALYLKKGGKGDISGQFDVEWYDDFGIWQGTSVFDVSGENTVTLDYIEFPILGLVSLPLGTMGTFDFFAGPAFAFNTKAKWKSEAKMYLDGQRTTLWSESEDIKDHVKKLDIGLVFGAGFTLNLQELLVFGEARLTYGFTEFIEYDDPLMTNPDFKNRAFGVIVGLGIPLANI